MQEIVISSTSWNELRLPYPLLRRLQPRAGGYPILASTVFPRSKCTSGESSHVCMCSNKPTGWFQSLVPPQLKTPRISAGGNRAEDRTHNLSCPHCICKKGTEGRCKHCSDPHVLLWEPAWFLEAIACQVCNALSALSTRLTIISGADIAGFHGEETKKKWGKNED